MSETSFTIPDPGFAIKAHCFKQPVGSTNQKNDLAIPEQDHCISIGGVKNAFGSPIDAEFAIDAIRRFQKKYRLSRSPFHDDSFKNMEKDDLIEMVSEMKELHRHIVRLNYGMTMDKSMALKILSQPGCEGIRFYLCSKKEDNVSLVVVGVDACGFDLNYRKPNTIKYAGEGTKEVFLKEANNMPAIESVVTQSLSSDYVTPPDGIELDGSELKHFDSVQIKQLNDYRDCFILLNIALGNKTSS